ncbi:kinase domain protein (macronuclear) [Tetrahymena thermophila SB210]|uniref:Kinase domain protein n=1 Tax=Tetrahymena thermophila (strain SB210) TaxID=312017 RepID=Q228V5_TETTS|nr:kinase domain protein [Tetrahymena thermophila SB210]EAR81819.2 kinase domain protein [Tetrahymena thermophila SB210]|eukprot:XP_001029482.2 kinase domain protein [Tetrahymena thermophila SB210]
MDIISQNFMATQEAKQKLALHIQNRKRVKQMYQMKGVQMLDKPELMFSDIKEPKLNPQQASMYQAMKIELTEKGYSDFRFLGSGAQGLVLLAKDLKNQMRYAIKGVQVRDLQGNLYDEFYNQVVQEIDILKQCTGCPYVVSFLDSFEGKQFIYLVLNECQGTLKEIIEKNQNKRLNEISAIKYAKDITEGLYYIHSKNCLVNDLKMDNILIDYNGNAVVCDFGLGDKLTVKSGYSHNQYMGNFFYQAPECYDPTDKIGKVYYDEYQNLGVQVKQEPSNRSEACSLGYMIYSLFQEIDFNLVLNKHKPLNYDGEFQNFVYYKNLKQLIDGLTQFVPRNRLPIKEALIVLKGIFCLEFQLDDMLIEMIDGDTQKLASSLKNEIEFVQDFSNKFYPIIKNQQSLIEELKEDTQKIVYVIIKFYSIYSQFNQINSQKRRLKQQNQSKQISCLKRLLASQKKKLKLQQTNCKSRRKYQKINLSIHFQLFKHNKVLQFQYLIACKLFLSFLYQEKTSFNLNQHNNQQFLFISFSQI